MKLGVLLATVTAAVFFGQQIDRYVRSSSAFAISEISVTGQQRLSRQRVLQAAELAVGQNVFSHSPAQLEEKLLGHPWIADAIVRRILPSRIEIEVREHRPAFGLLFEQPGESSKLLLVSTEGEIIKPLEQGDPADLPVVTGLGARRLREESKMNEIFAAVLNVLAEYRRVGLAQREGISEVHVAPDDRITLLIGDSGWQASLGRGPFRRKLERLKQVYESLARREAKPETVFLDSDRRPDRAIVRVQ